MYSLSAYGEKPYFEASDNLNIKAINTANLLNRIHNGHDQNTEKATKQLRHAIHKKYIDILNKICEWRASENGSGKEFQTKRELKDLLSRKSSYTMLCRSMAAVRQLPEDFFD